MYAAGDLVGPPMEMFKARKCGVGAARNIMGEDYEFDFTEYPDFLHTTYEVTWCGLSEAEAQARYRNVIKIQMPPDDADPETFALPGRRGVDAVRVHPAGPVRLAQAGHRRGHAARSSARTTSATAPRTRSSTSTT